jgi:hypothetical protein
MRAATGHLATLSEIATILVEEVIRPEVLGDDTARLIRKAAALGRSTKTSSQPKLVEEAQGEATTPA